MVCGNFNLLSKLDCSSKEFELSVFIYFVSVNEFLFSNFEYMLCF